MSLQIPDARTPDHLPAEDVFLRVSSRELTTLRAIRAAVEYALTQTGDDVCWMDLYVKLSSLTGLPFDPRMLPRERMLGNCHAFVDSLLACAPYRPDAEAMAAYRAILADPWADEYPDRICRFFRRYVPRLLGVTAEVPA